MNKVSFTGRKTERGRSDSFMQPLHQCSHGEHSTGTGQVRGSEGAVLHIFSVKVSEHQLPTQLYISTQGLRFFFCGDD